MPSAGDGTGWDDTLPQDSDNVSDGPLEIRDLRKGIETRMIKEHSTFSSSSGGGEHKNGSAKAYYDTTFPTKRPNGTSDLDAADAGRLFLDSGTGVLWWWHGTTLSWHTVNLALANQPYARYSDIKANGTDGGTFTNNAWRTRVLNTEEYDPVGIGAVASNQVTLSAGTYRFRAICPAHNVDAHRARIRDVTNSVTLGESGNAWSDASANSDAQAIVECERIVADSIVIEVQHYCKTSKSGSGLGQAGSLDLASERYTVLHITKIA